MTGARLDDRDTPLPLVDALQTALAAEHAAVYVYGVLGGQTSASETPELFAAVSSAYSHHRSRRDHLIGVLADLLEGTGQEPVGPAPGYDVPDRLGTPAAVDAAARGVEEACTGTYAALVAATTGDLRRWAVTALTDAAVRGLSFGGRPVDLPGID